MVRSAGARMLLALLGALCAGACRNSGGTTGDGGVDAVPGDGPAGDLPGALALDFAATGCASYDLKEARCSGTPPLTVTFSPVSSASLTRFLWTFGDGTPPSTERAPTHTYVLPGSYDVSLVAEGAVGSVPRTRPNFVFIAHILAGAVCDVDAQCDEGLRCLCGSNMSCGATFPRGVCTRECDVTACDTGAVCASVTVPVGAPAPASRDGGAETRDGGGTGNAADASDASDASASASDATDASDAANDAASDAPSAGGPLPLCLAGCAAGVTCPAGLVCRALPAAAGAQARWALACVPATLRDVGDTCRDASGALDDDACATGRCADLGALGVCSATCGAAAECPPGSACATLGNGQSLCLRTCGADFACDRDPLLRCEPAGSAGPLGFQVTPPASGATYCAPRKCAAEADCAPAGACLPLGAGGHCQLP